MSLVSCATIWSGMRVRCCRRTLVAACTVTAVLGLVACGGDSGPDRPSAARPESASPTGTPSVPPLGERELIVFERGVPGSEERDLYAVEPDGGEPMLVLRPANYPHWSPDGRSLAFLACLDPPGCTNAVALLERATGEVHGLPAPDPDLFTACPTWAPSGDELACEGLSETDPGRNGIYTIRTSHGQGLTRITTNTGASDFPLAFSPDGTRLLFNREDPSRGAPSDHALFVTAVADGRPHRVTPWGQADDFAGWSPDGRTIVFGTNGSLFRVTPEGTGLTRIRLTMPDGSSAETAFDVGFSPDGTRIVFSLGSPHPGIYTARPDGTDVRQVTTGEDHHPNWGRAPGS